MVGKATATHRVAARDELRRGTFDLLVIGGGIVGIAAAWTAAQAGLRVALVDAGDFAGATSSASTKLVHGGLRYLQTGNIRLVAENHRERRALAAEIAPHLVTPRRFIVPVYGDGPHGAAKLGAGVFLYSALSAFGDGLGRVISRTEALRQVPALRADGLRAAAVYTDHQMNDSRVAIMTVRAAVAAGAVVLNHAAVAALRTSHGRVVGAEVRDGVDGTEFGIDARLVLNATGPWVDRVRALEDPAAAPTVRLSKGAHVVLKRRAPWQAAVTAPVDKYRVTFAIPWEDHLLLGTTDEAYDGDPADVRATDADITTILDEVGQAVGGLRRDDVTCAFAGLRVLPGGPGAVATAKRETVITEGRGGMLSIAGGKWTTYRHIGRMVLDRLGLGARTLPTTPLPGVAAPAAVAHRLVADRSSGEPMDQRIAAHLATHYGTLALDLADLIRADPALAAPVHPDGPDIWAQVVYARDHEWAATPEDVLRRRTTLTLRGLDTPEVRDRVDALLGDR
ncbi:glycerol-3-phosphate dehydrogenase/oxidase [Actinokineospora sp. UTMC 2448]|uniref:glycerol-3-phosphate dehydrogenase/oxidase n=1 Tax=Actinokineospora sp. UTMC 2448 TaxID=2268449 RepID=UPI002164796A|nr:glycerol-3-phosphate dehydrogenase/oxidase [Actinokineospora sp. UTMC 2448]UVS79163.1 Aerobic glycerol-3-phosphate dehydrogenase [Actinokineospora sp. UTMC 2448]